MAVDPKIGYPILIISAISLILVLFTKSDQVSTLNRIEDVENNMSKAITQSVANYGGISQTLGKLENLTNALKSATNAAEVRGNQTLGCILRVIADTDEDVELIKGKLGIPRDKSIDKIQVDVNQTHIVYRNGENVTYEIPPLTSCS